MAIQVERRLVSWAGTRMDVVGSDVVNLTVVADGGAVGGDVARERVRSQEAAETDTAFGKD